MVQRDLWGSYEKEPVHLSLDWTTNALADGVSGRLVATVFSVDAAVLSRHSSRWSGLEVDRLPEAVMGAVAAYLWGPESAAVGVAIETEHKAVRKAQAALRRQGLA